MKKESSPLAAVSYTHLGQGCVGNADKMIPITCALNPLSGREASMPTVPKAETPGRVVVVGAGPAGLMAAATAAERGHEVILLERSDRHGGQISLCLLYTSRCV